MRPPVHPFAWREATYDGAMPTFFQVSAIAQTIQLSLAPVFMLAAIGQILNVLAGRLARVIDRARDRCRCWRVPCPPGRGRFVWELKLLDERMSIINAALFLAVSSAVMACIVIALLFIANIAKFSIGTWIALAFIVAVALLICCLTAFMWEVRVSLRAIHVRKEILS
jgi:MFS family permease